VKKIFSLCRRNERRLGGEVWLRKEWVAKMIWPNESLEEIYLYTRPIDLRQGKFKVSRYTALLPRPNQPRGSVYIFVNKKRDKVKVIFRDSTDMWVCTKQTEKHDFSALLDKPRDVLDSGFAILQLEEARRLLRIGQRI
jgi:hypothetical protein